MPCIVDKEWLHNETDVVQGCRYHALSSACRGASDRYNHRGRKRMRCSVGRAVREVGRQHMLGHSVRLKQCKSNSQVGQHRRHDQGEKQGWALVPE